MSSTATPSTNRTPSPRALTTPPPTITTGPITRRCPALFNRAPGTGPDHPVVFEIITLARLKNDGPRSPGHCRQPHQVSIDRPPPRGGAGPARLIRLVHPVLRFADRAGCARTHALLEPQRRLIDRA